jgi:hypothetical protein
MFAIIGIIWGLIWMIGFFILYYYHQHQTLKYEQQITDLMNQGNHRNLDALSNPYLELQLHEWNF